MMKIETAIFDQARFKRMLRLRKHYDQQVAKALGILNTQEWDSDDLDKYMQGAYDSRCEVCDGAGKVLTTSTKEPNHYYETDEECFRKREGGY